MLSHHYEGLYLIQLQNDGWHMAQWWWMQPCTGTSLQTVNSLGSGRACSLASDRSVHWTETHFHLFTTYRKGDTLFAWDF